MRKLLASGCAAVVALAAVWAQAAEVKSGLDKGASIGAFIVEKCGGAAEDGVEVGKNLCYRCKLGGRPMAMVFARTADDKLAALVQELDKTVTAKKDQKLASFVTFLGKDIDEAKTQVKNFEKKHKAGAVALTVSAPSDQPNGPAGYKIASEADVTIILAKDGKVVGSHAVKAGGLDKAAIAKIVAETAKLVD